MHDSGMHMLREKEDSITEVQGLNVMERATSLLGRDLPTLLIKANMASDILRSPRLSDEDSAMLIAWALCALRVSQDPAIQTGLRGECFTITTDYRSMEELNGTPFLDSVLRETLRLHPPVGRTVSELAKVDVIPLGKPCVDERGRILDCVR